MTMTVGRFRALGALLSVSAFLAVPGVRAQNTGTTNQPNPPPQVCVNGKCVNTPVSPPTTNPGSAGGTIKWNPGHYMDSETVIYAGRGIANVQAEMDDLNNQDAVLGYRVNISWGALEPTKGNYDFSTLDAILNRLTTQYNKPKRLVVYLWLYRQGSLKSNDGSVVPLYIQQDSSYGNSPVAGSYGWWGANKSGASTGMYAAALYNAPVMDRLIALVQALGQHLDGNPYVEAFNMQEDATIAEAAGAYGPPDPNYTDAAWLAQLERFLAASTAAFPHTNVVMDNSWFDRPPSGVALQQWMASNRVAAGSSDMWGQSALASVGLSNLSDGIQTMIGVDKYGGTTDLRPKMTAMLAVEGPDIMGDYFSKYGGPWAPIDILKAANQTYFASHVYWTHLVGNEGTASAPVPSAAIWKNLAATISANPLTHTAYPADYPP